MTGRGLRLVVLGLTLSSSWGNGHATTYRALLKAMAARGHDILFLERSKSWYEENRDLSDPGYCQLDFYDSVEGLRRWSHVIEAADAVIVGSFVPEGVDVCRFVQRTARGVVAFYDIDTPVTLAKLGRGDHEYLSPDFIPGFDVYLSFTGGPTLARLEREFGALSARALYCCVDEALYHPLATDASYDLSYLGTYSDDRQPTLERLLIEPARRAPNLRLAVAGPLYPADIDWPRNVVRIDHVAPGDHADFYARSRFTLNVTRQDMREAGFSPSVRLFEAGACATPIISDQWAGLDELLSPGSEICVAKTSDDILRILTMNERDRSALGLACRTRVLAEHTASRRAQLLESILRDAASKAKSVMAPRRERHVPVTVRLPA